ncbi:hypothetical protein LshimejAT787_0602300 [Lyophyllum shimeji]|uniref:Uncharacterized protein n=1 Tax=Lyophyllum shimeji TaxID=47721 RepID=A0A9P3UMX1_LYOSH|nr:hypothetical protein LshimejAT787_0602300 [Lyophyllum shimeji]
MQTSSATDLPFLAPLYSSDLTPPLSKTSKTQLPSKTSSFRYKLLPLRLYPRAGTIPVGKKRSDPLLFFVRLVLRRCMPLSGSAEYHPGP